jgi:hypothetical protein
MEFDLVTNRYLYPDRYIKMMPYFLNVYFCSFTFVMFDEGISKESWMSFVELQVKWDAALANLSYM